MRGFFKPTLNKLYFTFLLFFSFVLSLLLWYLPLLDYGPPFGDILGEIFSVLQNFVFSPVEALYSLTQGYSGSVWELITITLRKSFIIPLLASYIVGCIVSTAPIPFCKQRFWQPSLVKTILTVTFTFIFFCCLFFFRQTNTGMYFFQMLLSLYAADFTGSSTLNPCPNSPYFIMLCRPQPSVYGLIVLAVIALTNTGVSYIFSCTLIFFVGRMKKRPSNEKSHQTRVC